MRVPSLLAWDDIVRSPNGLGLGIYRHIWTTARRWETLRESSEPHWIVRRIGPFIIAYGFQT